MAARTIAVANMKGGVGKTTLSMMLAETLAHQGRTVLLVDLDAQGSLSFALMGDERFEAVVDKKQTISQYFARRIATKAQPLSDFVVPAASLLPSCRTLDLVAAEPSLQTEERNVISFLTRFALANAFKESPEKSASSWLREEIGALAKSYEYIIFDCPPGISIFAFAGIQNSGHILIPATPDYLSLLAIRSMHSRVLRDAIGRRKSPQFTRFLNKGSENTRSKKTSWKRTPETIIEE